MRVSISRWAVLLASVLLSGCAPLNFGFHPEHEFAVSKEQAVVLVAVDSEIPLGHAFTTCPWPCLVPAGPAYALRKRRDILAFPVNVGTVFQLDKITTLDFNVRTASLNAEALKIDRPGIYYYGTIKGTEYSVGLGRRVDPYYLLATRRKFGTRFDQLEPVNFSWPSPQDDQRIRFGYPISALTQIALQPHSGKRLQLAAVEPVSPALSINCSTGVPLSLPEFLPYEEYVKRAFNAEMQAAGMYSQAPGSITLKGALTELAFDSQRGSAHWRLGLRLETPNGKTIQVFVKQSSESSLNKARACAHLEDAFPETVQKLIESVVNTPEFQAL